MSKVNYSCRSEIEFVNLDFVPTIHILRKATNCQCLVLASTDWFTRNSRWTSGVALWSVALRSAAILDSRLALDHLANLLVPAVVGSATSFAARRHWRRHRCVSATGVTWLAHIAVATQAATESFHEIRSPSLAACASCKSQQQASRN